MKLPTLQQIDAEIARRSLKEFVKQAWHVLEPDVEYVGSWHIDAMCEHLEAVSRGEIPKLIINIPPGHMKSLLVCVMWPAWEWATKPHLKWMFASYASHLSVRDSIKTRTLLQSDWYQKNFGHVFKLEKTNEVQLTNDKFGFRYATSVGGVGTGERVHRVVNDDLLNATDAQSPAMREQAIKHLRAMATRGVPSEPFGQVLIMQRLHENDPTGWAMEQGGWEKLILPAEFDPERRAVTSIGFEDPRTEPKELLWPALFDQEKIDLLKQALGKYDAAAQLDQLPSPPGGGIIQLAWLEKYYKELPQGQLFIIQSWDTAFKTKEENDYSVCTTWAAFEGKYYLIHRYKAKVEYPELRSVMLMLYLKFKPMVILIEDKASGQSLIQEMKREITVDATMTTPAMKCKLPIKAVLPDRDKLARANAVTTVIDLNTYFPNPIDEPWMEDYQLTLSRFPNATHDDDVDSTTQALYYLAMLRPPAPYQANMPIVGR